MRARRQDLAEPTSVHWHGVRLPNAMDGVPGLTQAPVAPGASFDYRFRPPDAGTFWYRSHAHAAADLDRGLYGALIVEETEKVDVDQNVLLIFDDWRPAFVRDLPVRSNERLRLRLVNAAQ